MRTMQRTGTSQNVKKVGGAMNADEEKKVQSEAAAILGPPILSTLLDGKTLSPGDGMVLPKPAAMRILRETDPNRFSKLTSRITLQSIKSSGAARIAVFNIAVSFVFEGAQGVVLESDMTGTLEARVDTLWVVGLDVFGPLKMTAPEESGVKFEPGTFNFNYKTSFE